MDYLRGNNLQLLIIFLESRHVFQGYGLLNEIPVLYGFLWNTPKLIQSMVDRLHGLPVGGTTFFEKG